MAQEGVPGDAEEPGTPAVDIVREVAADGGVTTRTFDAADQPRTVTDPLGHTTTMTWDGVGNRLREWAADGRYAVLTGDLNVAHTVDDLKNWKGNRGKAGFLPAEQAVLDEWVDGLGFVDVHRRLHGPGPGPYTWWSWRGKAFDTDAGWRIDYQLASAPLAALAVSAEVGRAATYAQRWSDHAPVGVRYALTQ